ncbi:retrograde regulation protein [Pochonia chlamydosporia 170]|uniref:Retrograde regulation protein n=1 Tax=Pochonia chlamydosporia 170 TaxID=1380566 RepID=A0A179G402_METCM|nr:retrograde regulation protein [Pochonia chlamydosporia 170]OAQ72582.1 retrograde regulation protein [Pochonia chlamydosporia 170]
MPPSDVITLETLHDKLPLWHPDDDNHLYAIIDMGSNGIRFSVTSLKPPTTRLLEPLYSSRAAISLFDALTPSDCGPVFPSETIEAVASALSGFRRVAVMHGVPQSHIMILATEAMRRAANGGQMLEAIAAATDGLGVQILDPAVETLFGAVMGSRSGLVSVPNGALFLDLGGGSVQMTWVDTSKDNYEINAAMAGESLPYGAAKLTKVLEQQRAEIQAKEISTLQDGITRIYSNLCSRFPALQAIKQAYDRGEDASVDVYMCGGGFRGYGSMLMHNDPISPYPIPSTHTYSVPGSQFKQPTKMRQVNESHDGKIYGMSKRRRQQFPAIATVIESFLAVVPNIRRVTFCGGSNRQGALLMKMPKEIRESNPLEVLAKVTDVEKPIFDAILDLLTASIPKSQDGFSATPTILTPGLGALFIRHIWARLGHSSSSNSSWALHHAVVRDLDCPGLTHLARALLALTTCARWGNDIGPSDESLWRGLKGVVESHHPDATFWALYIGAVANILATLFPVMPEHPSQLLSVVRLDTALSKTKSDRSKVELTLNLSAETMKCVNFEELASIIKSTTKTKGDKGNFKPSIQFSTFS